MGASTSRNANRADRRPRPTASYRYPPEDGGNYFSSHYYLGHRKFECGDPELFLFGELPDLNYLPAKPSTFPYKQPPKSQPVSCLRSYINLQRESLKLVKSSPDSTDYQIEFTFDSDVSCTFTILKAIPDTQGMADLPNTEDDVSTIYSFPTGSDQQFKQSDYIVTPSEMDEDKLTYDPENDKTHFPLVILMQTSKEHSDIKQSQVTICSLEKVNDNGYSIKVLKQKLMVDGVEYLLQEVYGLENKAHESAAAGDDSDDGDSDIEEDLGAECVICITDVRDTILLPCRHLCLCSSCAANLRYQSSNCPICRAPFRALLQIQALEPLDPDLVLDDDEATGNPKYSIPGYQCVPLLQALNGYNLEEREELEEDVGPQSEIVAEEENTETSSPTPRPVEDFCVVPIEDEPLETDGVSPEPALPPTRTTLSGKSQQAGRGKVYMVDEDNVPPLPGTPVNDQHHVTLSLEDRDWKVDGSHCGSSVSSEVSVKSSDMLLPANKQ